MLFKIKTNSNKNDCGIRTKESKAVIWFVNFSRNSGFIQLISKYYYELLLLELNFKFNSICESIPKAISDVNMAETDLYESECHLSEKYKPLFDKFWKCHNLFNSKEEFDDVKFLTSGKCLDHIYFWMTKNDFGAKTVLKFKTND